MAEMLRKPDTHVAASKHYPRKLVLVGVAIASLAALLWSAASGADLDMQLEAAIHREIVLGDLHGAIEEYRKILAEPGAPRPVAARALLQTSECLEKLGMGIEAYNTYRKVVSDYKDQVAVVNLANKRLASWIGPRNLKFEEGVPGKSPPFPWTVQAAPADVNYVARLRADQCYAGPLCAVVTAPVNVPGPGNVMQSFSAASYRGKTVRLRAWLRLERIFETDIGQVRLAFGDTDRAKLWLRVVRTNGAVGFSDSMDDRPITVTDWQRAEITGQIDDDARTIHLGVMSYGAARAWVDDISFEVIEK